MKSLIILSTIIIAFCFSFNNYAQFDLEKTIKKKIEKKVEKGVNKTIDEGLDETEEAIKKGGKEEDKANKTDEKSSKSEDENESTEPTKEKEFSIWSKYDFVAGDNIIFEDDLSREESGEFPSRWDLLSGSAEVATLDGENVIHLAHSNSIIFPLMNKKDFLPDIFTIEFDVFFEKDGATRSDIYKIRFYDGTGNSAKIDGKTVTPIELSWNNVKMGQFGGNTSSFLDEKKNWQPKWKHIAISFNKRSLKLYMDEERMLNIPNLGFKPKMFSIGGHYDDRYIKMSSVKNIRVNEGGKKLYDKVVADGKFVTRGILFEVNKATINGESMGTINEIVTLMNEHPNLKFRIEGHTDSDGEDLFNLNLSEERASAVKVLLVKLGINSSRLESKGLGESKPVSENSTPEGKANNRRVEFVKI